MKHQASLKWLVPLIGILALLAAGFGLFDTTPGEPYSYTNHRGETVLVQSRAVQLILSDTVGALLTIATVSDSTTVSVLPSLSVTVSATS